jgi:hypothetical protein
MVTVLAIPKVATKVSGLYEFLSNDEPAYSDIYCPPVKVAISCIIAFLFYPNEGALTTHTLRLLFNLLMINVVSNSLSTS